MSGTLPDLDAAITAHIDAWTLPVAKLVRDNEPARTRDAAEWVRLTVLNGAGFIALSTGIRDVSGSVVRHPFVLLFDVYVPLDGGVARASTIAQAISDHWQIQRLAPYIYTRSAGFTRIGEEPTHYHTSVDIGGYRDETLTV